MIEQQVRDRVTAIAADVACAPVPLADIRSAGRALARRRTRVRVASSAAVVGVGAAVVAVPAQGPGGVDRPMPATQPAQPSAATADTSPERRRGGRAGSLTSAELNACLKELGEEPVTSLVEALGLPRSVLRACDRRVTGDG